MTKVFIICPGVGHINRGYESFTRECFNTLKDSKEFDMFLLKGAGKSEGFEIKIPCIKRGGLLSTLVFSITKKEKYWVEQLTFFFGMIPSIIKHRPKVIYYSDFILGTFLWHLRRFFKFKYKLLFSNGAPNGPPYTTMDHVQQLLPMYIKEAINSGFPFEMQTLLPYAIEIDKNEFLNINKSSLRNEFNLPLDKKIIICVGAIDRHHKRIDYLIDEFSLLENNYFLIVLGQQNELSKSIIEEAEQKLFQKNYLIKQVKSDEVRKYLALSDYFILPSLSEGLPRVLPEALSTGLIPIVHDYTVTRQTLLSFGSYVDMKKKGILRESIYNVDKMDFKNDQIIDFAYHNYSWDILKYRYEKMITKLIV